MVQIQYSLIGNDQGQKMFYIWDPDLEAILFYIFCTIQTINQVQ